MHHFLFIKNVRISEQITSTKQYSVIYANPKIVEEIVASTLKLTHVEYWVN